MSSFRPAGGSAGNILLPTNFPNLLFWFRADLGVTGDPVTQWDDQGPNGYNLTSVTGTPNVESAAVNGHDAIRFNRASGEHIDAAAFTSPPSGDIHAFTILRQHTSFVSSARLWSTQSDITGPQLAQSASAPTVRTDAHDGGLKSEDLTGMPAVDGDFACVEYILRQGSEVTGSVNFGTEEPGTVVGTCTMPDLIVLGADGAGTSQCNVDIAEIFMYHTSELSAAQRSSIQAYLSQRYGLF